MLWKAHVAFGFVCVAVAFWLMGWWGFLNSPQNALLLFAVVLVFAVLPDVDSGNSKASKWLRYALVIAAVWFALSSAWVPLAITIAVFLVHWLYARDDQFHRGFPHTIAFGAIMVFLLYFFTLNWLAGVSGGTAFASHLVSDGRLDFWRGRHS